MARSGAGHAELPVYAAAKGNAGRPLQHTWPRDRRLRRDSMADPRIGEHWRFQTTLLLLLPCL